MGNSVEATAPPWVPIQLWRPPEVVAAENARREQYALEQERIRDLGMAVAALADRSLEGVKE
tara:strand:- start:923 stop:1108 length:186 start_codon:yes stop_codon:yes gene_type:complete